MISELKNNMNEEFSEEEFEDKRLRILLYGSLALAIWMIVSGIVTLSGDGGIFRWHVTNRVI